MADRKKVFIVVALFSFPQIITKEFPGVFVVVAVDA
jgi:hypothetical protein